MASRRRQHKSTRSEFAKRLWAAKRFSQFLLTSDRILCFSFLCWARTFMDPRRIAELLQPFLLEGAAESSAGPRLSQAQIQSISIYIDMILRWNERVNLTAVREPEEIVTRHFGESLFTARYLFPRNRKPLEPTLGGQQQAGG